MSVLSKILHVSFLCLEQILTFTIYRRTAVNAVFGVVKETTLNNHRILSGKNMWDMYTKERLMQKSLWRGRFFNCDLWSQKLFVYKKA